MTRLELLTLLYSLETILDFEDANPEAKIEKTKEVIKKVIREAEKS